MMEKFESLLQLILKGLLYMLECVVVNLFDGSIFGSCMSQVKESSIAKMAQEKKIMKVDDMTTNGLRVPGSNWEKYKSLIIESNTKNKEPTDLAIGKSSWKRMKTKKRSYQEEDTQPKSLQQNSNQSSTEPILTRQVAMDCEMVGIGDGSESMLARVSLVNKHGVCIYDKYVKPTEEVSDYRSSVSGIYPHHLKDGEDFKVVQQEVAAILKGRILIGHAIKHDLEVLYLSHPKWSIRDTSRYKPFKRISNGNTPSLKKLSSELLGIKIQTGEHNSIEDARSTMQLYMLYRKKWETELSSKRR